MCVYLVARVLHARVKVAEVGIRCRWSYAGRGCGRAGLCCCCCGLRGAGGRCSRGGGDGDSLKIVIKMQFLTKESN